MKPFLKFNITLLLLYLLDKNYINKYYTLLKNSKFHLI